MPSRSSAAVLGEFLRSRRAAFDPSRLQIPSSGRRRTPGIRREELALLAGVSASYYTRIEQGAVAASRGVLDAIADALSLNGEDRTQMHRLARAGDERIGCTDEVLSDALPEGVDQVLERLHDIPAGVLANDMRVVAWNRMARAVFGCHLPPDAPSPGSGGLNWARVLFCDPASRTLFADWEAVAHDLVGRMRAARAKTHDHTRLDLIIAELERTSVDFARLWKEHPVREQPLGEVHLRHPVVGDLTLRDVVLRPTSDESQLLLLFTAAPGSDSSARLGELSRRLADTP